LGGLWALLKRATMRVRAIARVEARVRRSDLE